MTASDAGLRPAMDNARRPDVEVCFYHPCGFFWAQVLGFPIQRVREMKKRCPQCGCSRNAMCNWERCKSKPILTAPPGRCACTGSVSAAYYPPEVGAGQRHVRWLVGATLACRLDTI